MKLKPYGGSVTTLSTEQSSISLRRFKQSPNNNNGSLTASVMNPTTRKPTTRQALSPFTHFLFGRFIAPAFTADSEPDPRPPYRA